MKTKRALVIFIGLVALAALMSLGIFRETRRVHAQDQIPPPQPERTSFGMVGITQGQTIRLSVVNTYPPGPTFPPGPSRVVLTFLDAEGHHFRNRSGEIIRRTVMLANGEATFLDLNYDELPPGPSRLQLRAVVNVLPPGPTDNELPPGPVVPSVEIFNNANGRTVVFIGNPGVIRGFNPQPDPPL